MKVIIDIPDKAYELLKSKSELDNIAESIIANGIPLPKGHGDLIDRNVAYDVLDNADLSLNCSGLLKYIPAIILADK